MKLLSLVLCYLAGLAIAACAQRGAPEAAENPPLAKTEAEKRILEVQRQMVAEKALYANVPMADGRLMRILTEAVNAKHVVEVGTSTGYSGLWFCQALKNTGGRLTTLEIDAERAALARKHFEQAGVMDMVTLIEGDAHQTVKQLKEPIDVLFIDADKEGYALYLNTLLPLVRPGGLVLGHNVTMAAVQAEYNKLVTTNPDLETVFYMTGNGLGVTLKKR